MQPIGGRLEDHDHEFDEVRWIALQEAPGLMTYETEREVMSRAAGRLGGETAAVSA